MTFSLVINHTPWISERRGALTSMMNALALVVEAEKGVRVKINDTDYRGRDWQEAKVEWALTQWRWAHETGADHHIFMTDDLHIAPRFWEILSAMAEARPEHALGLLSNHPAGPALAREGRHGYRTNSWLVGPCYVLSHRLLGQFLQWFDKLPDGPHTVEGTKAYRNDDSSLNEFITRTGFQTWHPLPTIIEHRSDVESTVGHGDRFSRERVSWRTLRSTVDTPGGNFEWRDEPASFDLEAMTKPEYWAGAHIMMRVGE